MIKAMFLASFLVWGGLSFAHAADASCEGHGTLEVLQNVLNPMSKGFLSLTAISAVTTIQNLGNRVDCQAIFHFAFASPVPAVKAQTKLVYTAIPGVTNVTDDGFDATGTYHVTRSDDGNTIYVTVDQ